MTFQALETIARHAARAAAADGLNLEPSLEAWARGVYLSTGCPSRTWHWFWVTFLEELARRGASPPAPPPPPPTTGPLDGFTAPLDVTWRVGSATWSTAMLVGEDGRQTSMPWTALDWRVSSAPAGEAAAWAALRDRLQADRPPTPAFARRSSRKRR